MTEGSNNHRSADLAAILRAIRRRAWLVLVCALLSVAAAAAVSLSQEKEFTATAALLFRDPGLDQKLFGSTYLPPSSDPAREAATNVKLVSLEVVADRTARRLKNGLDGTRVAALVDVAAQGNSDVVSVNARGRTPQAAATLANAFTSQYIAFRRDADRAKISEAQRLVESRLPLANDRSDRERLLSQAQQLRVLASLQTGNAELVQPAKPPGAPSSPKTLRNSVLGFILGLLIGVMLAVGLERLDRRLRTTDDIQEVVDLPLLGSVPLSAELGGSQALRSPLLAEAFRMLRARLRYFNVDRKMSSIMVTSALPREGKSTVAWNLAAAAASMGEREVILVELDLHRPTIATRYGLPSSPGLSELLSHDIDVATATQQVHISAPGEESAGSAFNVIVAGRRPPNPAALLDSTRMLELLATLAERYDLVVFDTPPASVVSDAIPLMERVEGVIVVTRLGESTRDSLRAFAHTLTQVHARVLGVVANGDVTDAKAYDYGYYDDWQARPSVEV